MTARRNLVVVRAGKTSLHPGWLDRPSAERSFDLVVSYFDDHAHAAHVAEPGVEAMLVPGGKWDGLFKTLSRLNWRDYERIWLPDDDIATDAATIDGMFALSRAYGLAVAQPSLSRASYYSYFLLSQCRAFVLRYTNFIESMVPCLDAAVLEAMLPEFEHTMSGFGLDRIWSRLGQSGAFRVAVLDSVAVHHTRPVGGVLRGAMRTQGASVAQEGAEMATRHGLTGRILPMAYAGIVTDGSPILGQGATGRAMARSWWQDLRDFRDPRTARSRVLQTLKRQHLYRADLSLIDRSPHTSGSPGDPLP